MTLTGDVLVFDVNETLLDLESLTPVFTAVFDDPAAMRGWFGQLVMYSMTATLSQRYLDFFTLGRAVLQMLGDIRGVTVTDAHLNDLGEAMANMPAHPDVIDGLTLLRDHGWRIVSLTNSPPSGDGSSPLDRAGLGGYFERRSATEGYGTPRPWCSRSNHAAPMPSHARPPESTSTVVTVLASRPGCR
jgi:2-haloacid dehalogenase